MTISGDVLRKAAEIVDGPRNTTHGDKQESFTLIAQFITTYLRARKLLVPGAVVAAKDVAQFLVLQKMIRSASGRHDPDHGLDQCGYSGIFSELAIVEHDRKSAYADVSDTPAPPDDNGAPFSLDQLKKKVKDHAVDDSKYVLGV